jgi:thiol-disulfide isomerase/thioredoxin
MVKISTFIIGLIALASMANSQQLVTGLEIGNKAPELNYNDPNGKSIALSSLKGKMVLIDFWASWCPPCRRENPVVVATYKEFKDKDFKKGKGFTIYSVSLDRDKNSWVKGIQDDKLEWPNHVSDLKYWSSAGAATYGVQGIPTNWLIDGNGVIVAKNLRGESLKATLAGLVK